MKKAILSVLVLISMTACAQRLKPLPKKAGEATEKTATKDAGKDDQTLVKKVEDPAAAGSAKAEEKVPVVVDAPVNVPASVPADAPAKASTDPAPVAVKVSNCSVEFVALSEKDAADVMTKLAGNWIEGGINTVRNVVPSNDTTAIPRTVISLGARNEEISISKLTFKLAENVTPGKSPYEVVSTEKLAQAASYRVSSAVQGYNLVELMTTSPSGAMQCTTFAFKFEVGPAKAQDALRSLGPVKDQKLSGEEFIAAFKAKEKVLSRQ